jgi:lipoprotein-anchoring transpeptidase ErfK/SrfK
MERLGLALHTVRPGELPGAIAARYRIGAELLSYLNQDYDERRLRVGQKLKVLDLSDRSLRLRVQKQRYRLDAWRELSGGARVWITSVPVGLGAPGSPTPLGSTTINKRVLDPQWTHPETKQVFAPGDPGNVLGGYWIALDAAGLGGRNGIGLHGFTGAPAADWIQQPASHGCVRLLQADIDRVFHLALEGTPVVISD